MQKQKVYGSSQSYVLFPIRPDINSPCFFSALVDFSVLIKIHTFQDHNYEWIILITFILYFNQEMFVKK